MRDLIKSMMSFSWGMSLFGMRQMINLLGGRGAESFDAVTQAMLGSGGTAGGQPGPRPTQPTTQPAAPPAVPEWERIATAVGRSAAAVVRGEVDLEAALARLDHDVDGMLEKRRWLLDRERS